MYNYIILTVLDDIDLLSHCFCFCMKSWRSIVLSQVSSLKSSLKKKLLPLKKIFQLASLKISEEARFSSRSKKSWATLPPGVLLRMITIGQQCYLLGPTTSACISRNIKDETKNELVNKEIRGIFVLAEILAKWAPGDTTFMKPIRNFF